MTVYIHKTNNIAHLAIQLFYIGLTEVTQSLKIHVFSQTPQNFNIWMRNVALRNNAVAVTLFWNW